jgi:predicted N-formylglutamate amidohydrolase
MKVIITCEHGGNKIPSDYQYLFQDDKNILQTHRAYDPGALELSKQLSKKGNYFFFSEISRLLIELNRSIHSPNLFSKFSKNLSRVKKKEILNKYYFPYRNEIENLMMKLMISREKIIHISVHSFTPVLKNEIRNADIGILYDPKRNKEKLLASKLKQELLSLNKSLKIRFNYPYLGISDGFTTYLRRKFDQEYYTGIELEVNQKYVLNNEIKWKVLKENLTISVDSIFIIKTDF